MSTDKHLPFSFILLLTLLCSACGTIDKAKYSALEQVGIHKRDILIDRIEETSETQEQTKQEFKDAYEELKELIGAEESDLEKKYAKMQSAVESSENKANELSERIEAVDRVAKSLFKEWKNELDEYSNDKLRDRSAQNLKSTKKRYDQIYAKMKQSRQQVTPVLEILQDNSLFLKHNLNARAVAGLSREVIRVEGKVEELIAEMEASIAESKNFVSRMQSGKTG